MSEDTQIQIQDTDEDVQLNTEIDNLNKKADKTPEDIEKLGGLKKERSTRYQTKITHLTSDKKAAEYEAQMAKERLAALERENEELKNKPAPIASVANETEEYGGKAYYTDTTLQRMVDSRQISEAQAIQMQEDRREAKIEERLEKKFEAKHKNETVKQTKERELAEILTLYPHWMADHPKYNPKDPLMIETADLYNSGIPVKRALEKAKKIVGVQGRIDNTDNLSLHSPSAPDEKSDKVTVKMTEDEEYLAKRTFMDKKNPVTGRNYTEKEAVEVAKKAKQKQEDLRQSRRNK